MTRSTLPRCRLPHVVGEPCPSCWYTPGEDAGGGRPASRWRSPTTRAVLLGGLVVAADWIRGQRQLLAWTVRLWAASMLLAGREREEARQRQVAAELGERDAWAALEVARGAADLLAAREARALRVAERLADRAVVAEARLEAALAALPALEGAVEGPSRLRVRAALALVQEALGARRRQDQAA